MQRMGATAAAAAFKHPFGFRTSPDGQSAVRCLPFRARTHSITGRPRRDGADREKCVLPSPSSHKATLVNQPEMLITEEGGRAEERAKEGGWRKGRRTIDRSRERASEREVLCRPAAFCNSDLCGRRNGQILLVLCTRASLARRWSSVRL